MTILVTGGAGFIGTNFIAEWLPRSDEPVVNLDKLTYAGNMESISRFAGNNNHSLVHGDIADRVLVPRLLAERNPRAIINFAAESHVDRSIAGPAAFIQTNVVGTFELLEATRIYWSDLPANEKASFRFLHISTDEVYGSLRPDDPPFTEETIYAPNSPYSASKAASDHLVRAYYHTYGMPVITTNCSNNYGPFQYPEKLIPVVIRTALAGSPIPVYGKGENVRDWLYVTDHCAAIRAVLDKGRIGETYNIGGNSEIANIDLVRRVCMLLDEMAPLSPKQSYQDQICFVEDRPGHDFRYAVDARKITREIGWTPAEKLDLGLPKTVRWYLDNQTWVDKVLCRAQDSD
ncbi:dTDP-glucose 4,6-dehydratase [Mesorhizobium sp. A623]